MKNAKYFALGIFVLGAMFFGVDTARAVDTVDLTVEIVDTAGNPLAGSVGIWNQALALVVSGVSPQTATVNMGEFARVQGYYSSLTSKSGYLINFFPARDTTGCWGMFGAGSHS